MPYREKRGKMTAVKGLWATDPLPEGGRCLPYEPFPSGNTKIRQKSGPKFPKVEKKDGTEALKKDFTF
jgi:hypothetical protein